jgi:alpha-L-fucosidase
MKKAFWFFLISLFLFFLVSCGGQQYMKKQDYVKWTAGYDMEQLQRDFVDLRFGMFIHFGILTYTGTWAQKNLDITKFKPVDFNPGQWADVAKEAGMKFGVLTTKHHDGFALWQTDTSDFSVKGIPWKNGKGDVVREYVDAFRARGLLPGLYYSIWDNTKGIGNKPVARDDIEYVKKQLKELLTKYGDIPILVLDGWSWKMGHKAMPYDEIKSFIKSLQPGCLVIDHTHLQCLWDNDLIVFEEPKGVFAPEGNVLAAAQDQKIINGNDWFWGEQTLRDEPMGVAEIVEKHLKPLEKRYTVFILNCPPNRNGLLDEHVVRRLKEVGKVWKPDLNRKQLPKQPPQNEKPIIPASVTATSGNADFAIDGINDAHFYSVWETEKKLPQSIIIDLGEIYPDVGILCYVPKYVVTAQPTNEGAITSYKLSVSEDGVHFEETAKGNWKADSSMKVVTFKPAIARYVKLEVLKAKGGFAAATEISVGRK